MPFLDWESEVPRVNGYDIEERWFVLDHPRGPLVTFESEQEAIDEVAILIETYEVAEETEVPKFKAAKGWFVVCCTILKSGAYTNRAAAQRTANSMLECNGEAPKLEPDNPDQAKEKATLEKEKNSTRTPPAVNKNQ